MRETRRRSGKGTAIEKKRKLPRSRGWARGLGVGWLGVEEQGQKRT
jgi:hypothetical protein